ncbi:toll-like receptor 4 [Biomphalaria glabrata]|uniref:Toll-like receptor 4 n=1 Tax=Biomphalaria glabrata TaxID=6526 RepID=A0A9W2Z157_BIOGL|nr:toll-like receptor 4 [Biomphalaria glabrata]KAI8751734.1 CD180 antigen-like [Biomphalaria glabrata]
MRILLLICITSWIQVTLSLKVYDIDCIEYMPESQDKDDACDDFVVEAFTPDHVEGLNLQSIKRSFKNVGSVSHEDQDTFNNAHGQCTCDFRSCNCSKLNLKLVPNNLPRSIQKLRLDHNSIAVLPNCTFCSYSQLNYLDLSFNKLTQLQVGSFWGLEYLIWLNLGNNCLMYVKETFPNGVFSDLVLLRCLKLHRNLHNHHQTDFQFPDEVLANLTNLESFYLDGFDSLVFGEHFKNLTKLKILDLSQGYCNIMSLSKSALSNIYQISKLNLSSCNLQGDNLNNDVFKPLVNLKLLDISFNTDLGVKSFMPALKEIRNYNITTLIMNFIESLYSPSVLINKDLVESLPSSLIYLEAQGNNFESIETGALEWLPPNLTYIIVGANRFFYGDYFNEIYTLRSVKVLNLNGLVFIPNIPKYVPQPAGYTQCSSPQRTFTSSRPLVITLPPNLLCLDLRFTGLRYVLTELTVNASNSLESLIICDNYFPLLNGPIIGLPKLLKLYISDSNVKDIKPQMFEHLRSLQELRLRNDQLQFFFEQNFAQKVFMYLKNLRIIDLSKNGLALIQKNIFDGLNLLEEIDMSRNEMWAFNVSILNMLNLRILNLSHTQLSSLPLETRQHIDLVLTNHSVFVDLSFTPIHCDCTNIDFLKWMTSSGAFDANFTNYMCRYENSSSAVLVEDAYLQTFQYLDRKCTDHSILFLVVIAATFFMVTCVIVALLYRFRWRLRYLYYAAYLMMKGQIKNTAKSEQFHYDVFISYAYQDDDFILKSLVPELTERKLSVLVHGRDFAVGEFIASNIMTAVKESRKTLVVLTRNLLKSTWCNFEIQMANMESVHTGRPVLVFLIKESIPTAELTSDLLYHLNRNTYIVYPQGEITDVFWDKLARDLSQS